RNATGVQTCALISSASALPEARASRHPRFFSPPPPAPRLTFFFSTIPIRSITPLRSASHSLSPALLPVHTSTQNTFTPDLLFAPAPNERAASNSSVTRAFSPSLFASTSAPMAHIYVNRGLGTVGAPVRLGVPPEISLIVLRTA